MKKLLLVFLSCISLVFSINLFNIQYMPTKNGASCMDGSPFAIYTFQPDPIDCDPQNKLLIYFEDLFQGWCAKDTLSASIPHCYRYLEQQYLKDWGSSDNYPDDMFFLSGILSLSSKFSCWSKVFIKSCDGGAYFGDNQIIYKSKTMRFKGRQNMLQAINYLNNIKWLQNRQEVMLVGSLNGGLAALMWADYIQTFAKKTKVSVVADGAITILAQNQKQDTDLFQSKLKMVQKMFIKDNYYLLPNQKCQDDNKDELWQCFLSQNLVNYVSPNIYTYFTQSYYDGWAIFNILGYDCAELTSSLSECSSQHRKIIGDYHHNVTLEIAQLNKKANVNIFGIACVAHFFLNGKYDYDQYTVPMNTNNTVQNILFGWSRNKSQNWTRIDEVQWPHNTPCSHKLQIHNINHLQKVNAII